MLRGGEYVSPLKNPVTKKSPTSKDWVISIPNKVPAIIMESFPDSLEGNSYIALARGKKIIIHHDSICKNF